MSKKNKYFGDDFPKKELTEPQLASAPEETIDNAILEEAAHLTVPTHGRTVKVSNTSLLNIREHASVTSAIVAVVGSGTAFNVLEDLGDWTKVESLNLGQTVVGYALTKYLGAT